MERKFEISVEMLALYIGGLVEIRDEEKGPVGTGVMVAVSPTTEGSMNQKAISVSFSKFEEGSNGKGRLFNEVVQNDNKFVMFCLNEWQLIKRTSTSISLSYPMLGEIITFTLPKVDESTSN